MLKKLLLGLLLVGCGSSSQEDAPAKVESKPQSAQAESPQVADISVTPTTAPASAPWSDLINYRLVSQKESDYKLATREKY
jgi:hypothetical protein